MQCLITFTYIYLKISQINLNFRSAAFLSRGPAKFAGRSCIKMIEVIQKKRVLNQNLIS